MRPHYVMVVAVVSMMVTVSTASSKRASKKLALRSTKNKRFPTGPFSTTSSPSQSFAMSYGRTDSKSRSSQSNHLDQSSIVGSVIVEGEIRSKPAGCMASCDEMKAEASESTGIPPCCSIGGLSSLKLRYRATQPSEFFLDKDPDLDIYWQVDPCEDRETQVSIRHGSSTDAFSRVRFATCTHCFPISNPLCNPIDLHTRIIVQPGDEICLVSFHGGNNTIAPEKSLPTDLVLFRATGHFIDEVVSTTIRTSCTKPIFQPFGVRLGVCENANDFLVNLSLINASDIDLLGFVDATSVSSDGEVTLSSCPIERPNSQCCKGGASFLKMRFRGASRGNVYFNKALMPLPHKNCKPRTGNNENISKKSSQPLDERVETRDIRFVACDDNCLLDPYNDIACSSMSQSAAVVPGDELCFGVWNELVQRFLYGQQMSNNTKIYFIADNKDDTLHSAAIHTSCLVPLVPPFAALFSPGCDEAETLTINMDDDFIKSDEFYLQFLDGISTDFFVLAEDENAEDRARFDITLLNCGCVCDPVTTAPAKPPLMRTTQNLTFPSSLPLLAPARRPSIFPFSAPSVGPTAHPTSLVSTSALVDIPTPFPTATPTQESSSTFRPSATPFSTPSVGLTAGPTSFVSNNTFVDVRTISPTSTPTQETSSTHNPSIPLSTPSIRPSTEPTSPVTKNTLQDVPTAFLTSAPTQESSSTHSSSRPSSAPSFGPSADPIIVLSKDVPTSFPMYSPTQETSSTHSPLLPSSAPSIGPSVDPTTIVTKNTLLDVPTTFPTTTRTQETSSTYSPSIPSRSPSVGTTADPITLVSNNTLLDVPTTFPTSTPTPTSPIPKSNAPGHNPFNVSNATIHTSCADRCNAFLYAFCNLVGVNGNDLGTYCDPSLIHNFGSDRTLVETLHLEDDALSGLEINEVIAYHDKMAFLYRKLLAMG